MGNASRAKKAKAKAQEEHLCLRCGLNLVEVKTTLGHNDSACAAYKLKMEREAARKKKKAASKKPASKN